MPRLALPVALLLALPSVGCGGDPDGGTPAPDFTIPAAEVDAAAPDLAVPVDAAAGEPDLAEPTGTRVRILAANITSGVKQAYEAPGVRIFQGLHPDIALIQEFNSGGSTNQEIRAFVDQAFGPEFVYFREDGPGIVLPNGVVSRYPIVQSGSWDDPTINNRDFAWARIDVPGPRDLWAVSAHLSTTNADRHAGAAALVTAIQATVPPGDYLAIGGDFNTDTRNEPAVVNLSAVAVVTPPYPADHNGNSATSAPRTRPYDWLLFDGDLDLRKVTLELGTSRYPDGLVFDSRVYTPLAEVAPVMAGDSGVAGMQHMAIVRDVTLAQ